MNIRNVIFAIGCGLVVGTASAISLGQSRGSVTLGAPVDLAFDVQLDPGADVSSSCVTADVAFGDSPVSDAKVRVIPMPELPGRSPAVRVQVVGTVNEPVITVTVSAGCSGKVTRTYTFLADLPATHAPGRVVNIDHLASASTSVPRDSDAGAVLERSASSRATRRPVQALAEPREQAVAVTIAPIKPRVAKPVASEAPSRSPRQLARKAPLREERTAQMAAAPERSRLVMEPLDSVAEPAAALRPSAGMEVMPAQASASQRLDAAAAWKALNTPLEVAQRNDERVRALEGEVAALRVKSTAESASLAELQQRLALIENQRFSAGLVYALLTSLVLALGVLAWVWARARRDAQLATQAWRDSVELSAMYGDSGGGEHHDLTPHPRDTWAPGDGYPLAEDTYIHSGPRPLKPVVTPDVTTEHAPQTVQQAQFTPRAESLSHPVRPEELFDIRQQAEFFVSLGEHAQAIDLLKKHIAAHEERSPSAYRELLRLYHKLGRANEYAQLREQFTSHFNVRVPEFSDFSQKGQPLEQYVDALAAIEADWTSPAVVQLLESFLFRSSGVGVVAPFDLAAFDDLLLLLAIAKTTPASARGTTLPRMRTTPLASSLDIAAPASSNSKSSVPAAPTVEVVGDSPVASLEFSFGEHVPAVGLSGSAVSESRDRVDASVLDLDLSDPPILTLSELPPVPVTAAPGPNQPIGFGMANDMVDLRLELEQRKPENKG